MVHDGEEDEGISVYVGKIYRRSSRPKIVMTSSQRIRERIFVAEGPVGKEFRCSGLSEVVQLASQTRATFISDDTALIRLLEQQGVKTTLYDPLSNNNQSYQRLQELLDDI